jgi:shikimate kinase
VRAVKLDLILVNNTGLVVSLGGGGLITPENLTLTTSSTAIPIEADIKIEVIREGTHTHAHR